MRSRYSAYCHKAIDYLYATYHPDQRIANSTAQIAEFAHAVHFIGLTITSSSDIINSNSNAATSGHVSFVASYINGNKLETLNEQSRFVLRINGTTLPVILRPLPQTQLAVMANAHVVVVRSLNNARYMSFQVILRLVKSDPGVELCCRVLL